MVEKGKRRRRRRERKGKREEKGEGEREGEVVEVLTAMKGDSHWSSDDEKKKRKEKIKENFFKFSIKVFV